MKITMTDGTVFEGTLKEYAELIAFAETHQAVNDAKAEAEQSDETLSFEGEQYRKVDREAQAGDVVVITKNDGNLGGWFTVGKAYEVIKSTHPDDDISIIADDYDELNVYSEYNGRTPETVDVYEKVEAEYVPQEGDIVVITANTSSHVNKIGDIGKVGSEHPLSDGGVNVYVPNGPTTAIRTKPADIRKATPAEVEAYEKAVADASKPKLKAGDFVTIDTSRYCLDITVGKAYKVSENRGVLYFEDDAGDKRSAPLDDEAYTIVSEEEVAKRVETEKWAKIGRKVGELKKGDLIEVISPDGAAGYKKGGIVRVANDSTEPHASVGPYYVVTAKLVAPVDARFDV